VTHHHTPAWRGSVPSMRRERAKTAPTAPDMSRGRPLSGAAIGIVRWVRALAARRRSLPATCVREDVHFDAEDYLHANVDLTGRRRVQSGARFTLIRAGVRLSSDAAVMCSGTHGETEQAGNSASPARSKSGDRGRDFSKINSNECGPSSGPGRASNTALVGDATGHDVGSHVEAMSLAAKPARCRGANRSRPPR
jgi:hypothetical protein